MGTYTGGGTFTLFSIRSFADDPRARIPRGFTEMDLRDLERTSSTGVIHLAMDLEMWELEEENKLALNTFIGIGYALSASRARTNSDGTI